ncbi:MAG: DNA mismatch repair protein MutS [Salibacteraceae bacterium]
MQNRADKQTIEDLEFDAVRNLLAKHCSGPSAAKRALGLVGYDSFNRMADQLCQAAEFIEISSATNGFPGLVFQELDREIKLLSTKSAILDLDGLSNLRQASALCNDILDFLQLHTDRFAHVAGLCGQVQKTDAVMLLINKVLDERNEVKDTASTRLADIRADIRRVRQEISRTFDRMVRKLHREGILADTQEAYINHRRVLAVISSYKRQVHGNVLGASNSGQYTYIEPRETMALNNELEMLLDDERVEIRRIFRQLTDELRKHLELIKGYQKMLVEMDYGMALARLARDFNGCIPAVCNERLIELHNAFHPLLLMKNKEIGRPTEPQSLRMDKFCRMVVISGPNAGGKSITLKMVGLLQMMVQSGLPVPVDPDSKFGWFRQILSDIGDHQSIENQLSTYSYRLQRMKLFLEVTDRNTLLLLDEFGSGSDPELGGALAEVLFEKLYQRKAFGVVTTHYSNIKILASKLKNAINASMQFDSNSLEPLFKLSVGQPGSSFTFEVALKNGIPPEIVDEAKKRLDGRQVEFERLINELQHEKALAEERSAAARDKTLEAEQLKSLYEELTGHLDERNARQQELIDKHNKELILGRKFLQFIEQFDPRAKNKKLLDEIKKTISIEKDRMLKAKQAHRETALIKSRKRKLKSSDRKRKDAIPPKPIEPGSTVRLKNGHKVGEVLEINNTEAVVLFGVFKTRAKLKDLEAV